MTTKSVVYDTTTLMRHFFAEAGYAELITVTQAAVMLGCTKDEMREKVDALRITKHFPNERLYLLAKGDIEDLQTREVI